MKWIKDSERKPVGVISFNTMTEFVAVHYFSEYSNKIITVCGRYCHNRKKWFIYGGMDIQENKENIIEWLDETK